MNRFRQIFICVLGAWLILNLAQTIGYVVADYSQIPVADYWRVPQLWANPQTVQWSNLWVQHNEHRIIFPELIYIFDMFFLHGRMYLPIAFSGACYLGIWCVLAVAAYSQKNLESSALQIALLLAGVVMFWKGVSTVIATPFQLQFTLLLLACALSFLFLAKIANEPMAKYLAALIAFAGICTYSSANGMLVWAVLIPAAVFLRIGVRQLVILCAAAVILSSAYFFEYHFLPSLISTNIKHPIQCLAFLCSYFSMPFGGYGPRTFGFKVGALHLVLIMGCAFVAWRKNLVRSRLAIVVFGTYLFILLSALLTTAGRMDLNDYLFAQAKAWRYVAVPTVSWALLVLALVWLAGSRTLSVLVALGISCLLFTGFRKASDWVETTRLDSQNGQITATMLRNGVFDSNQVRTIFPDPEFVRVYSKVMLENRKSIYARGDDKWVGGNLLSLPLMNTSIAGKVTRVYPVPGGLELFGWADTAELTDDHEILFADEENRIVGFGRRPAAGLPGNLSATDTPNPLAFVGYVSLVNPTHTLSVYARTHHGKAIQPLNQKLDIPAFTQMEERSDQPALPGVTWQPDQNWTLNGYTVDPENGPAPINVIYGSWSGSDAKTGAIRTAPFATPQNGCLVLPVLHGRASYGQTVALRDSDTGQTIVTLPMLDGRTIWERWRIPIPATTRNLAISGDDEGTGPNEWLALATPELCH